MTRFESPAYGAFVVPEEESPAPSLREDIEELRFRLLRVHDTLCRIQFIQECTYDRRSNHMMGINHEERRKSDK